MIEKTQIPLSEFWNAEGDGSYYVGHACVLAKFGTKKYLIDPVLPHGLFLDSWFFYPELALDPLLYEVDGVFISHCHEDHYDLNFLEKLKPGTPIYITEGRIGFEAILNNPKFNVKILEASKLNPISESIAAMPIPSDHNNIDSSFIIKSGTFGLLQGNDNFLSDDSIAKARSISGTINHAYIPYSYVWWYPYCLTSMNAPERSAESKRLTALNMHIGAKIGEAFGADLIVPSAGNLIFYEGADCVQNQEIASPYDFVEFAKENYPKLADKTRVLLAGDSALVLDKQQQIFSANTTREEYFRNMAPFLDKIQSEMPATPQFHEISPTTVAALEKKLSGIEKTGSTRFLNIKRRDLDDQNPAHITCDLFEKTIKISAVDRKKANSVTLDVQPNAFEMWTNGTITFETILNSQRFTAYRQPEVFDRNVWSFIRESL